MAATTTLMTVDEFFALPEIEGERRELIGGEILTMGYAKLRHEVVKANLNRILVAWLLQNPIAKLFVETIYRVSDKNALIPDLSVVWPNRIDVSADWFQGTPEIAIEVVSSETATTLERKIELYLAHGAKSVWVVFPETRVVRIFDLQGQSQKFEQGQSLEDPTLPGFRAPV